MKQNYVAVIDTEDGVYGVTFPDFAGCVSSADSVEGIVQGATEALTGHVALMSEDGDALPSPTSIMDINNEDGEVLVLIEVPVPGRKKRINVTLDENLISEIDQHTSNRSRFLEVAAREAMATLR